MAGGEAVWLDVLPSMSGFLPQLTRGVGKATSIVGKSAGKDLGDAMSKGMTTGLEKARVAAERTSKSVEDIGEAAKDATQKQEEATRKVAIAQAKLDRAKQDSRSTQDKILKAENDLIVAQERQEKSESAALKIAKQLTRAKTEQADAAKQLTLETEKAEKAQSKSLLKKTPKEAASGAVSAMGKGVKLGAAGVVAGGGALLGVTKQFFEFGNELNTMKNNISVATGASGRDLDRLAGTAQVLQTKMSGSSEEVTQAMLAVRGSIKGMSTASSKELQDTTVVAQGFAQSFEIDITRASQVAGQMITTGMAKNGVQAFDLLTAAAQKVPLALREDLLDAVDEYGPAFKQVGISGDQMMSILAKSSEKGMYGIDKTGDAIKELGIRMTTQDTNAQAAIDTINKYGSVGTQSYDKLSKSFAKGGPEGQKALKTVVDGLQSIKDPAQRANAAMQMFGTPLEDLNAADIPKFLSGMQASSKELGNFNGSAKRNADTLNSGPEFAMKNFTQTLKNMFAPVASQVFGIVNKGTSWMQSTGTPAIKKFTDEWKKGSGTGGRYRDIAVSLFHSFKSGTRFLMDHKVAVLAVAGAMAGFVGTIKMVNRGVAAYKATITAGKAAVSAFNLVQTGLQRSIGAVKWGVEAGKIVAHKTATLASTAATKAQSAAQKALSLAMGAGRWIKDTAAMAAHKAAQLASAAATWGITAAQKALSLSMGAGRWIKDTAAMVAHKAAQLASSAASKALAAGQWLVNAAMSANPIGLIVGLLVLLGAALIVAWKKSDTFRRIVTAAWNGIKAAASAVWNFLKRWVFDPLGRYFTVILPAGLRAWGRIFSSVWTGAKSTASAVWSWVSGHVLSPMKNWFTRTLPDAFSRFGTHFKNVWNGLKRLAATPANFLINAVWNKGLRAMLNKIPGVNLGEVTPIKMAKGGSLERGQAAATNSPVLWGEVPGTEEVYIPINNSQRSRNLASYAASRLGMDPIIPMAAGGVVGGSGSWTAIFAQEMQAAANMLGRVLRIAQRGFRPSTSYSGTSHRGDAVDVTGPGNLWDIRDALRKVGIYSWVRGPKQGFSWHVHGIPAPGHGTALGSAIYQRQAYAAGGDGLHGLSTPDVYRGHGTQVGIGGGGGGDDGGLSILTAIPNFIKNMKNKLTGGVMRTPWGKTFAHAGTYLLDSAKNWVTKKFTSLFSSGKSSASSNMETWRSTVAQALAASHIGGGKSDEDLWLKQIMTESSGNPNLVQSSALRDINVRNGDPARGLVQVPGVTWADFGQGMGSFIPNVYNPLKNLIVGMRAAYAQHGGPAWRRVIGKGHGYEVGTGYALPGLAALGERNSIELVVGSQFRQMNGGEKVYSSAATRRLMGGGGQVFRIADGAELSLTEDGKAALYNVALEAIEDNDATRQRIGAR